MAFDKIGLENLPNSYFSQIKIQKCLEGNVVKIVPSEVVSCLYDYSRPDESVWRQQKFLQDYLKVRVVFVAAYASGRDVVQSLLSGDFVLKDLENIENLIIHSSRINAKNYLAHDNLRANGNERRRISKGSVAKYTRTISFGAVSISTLLWNEGVDVYAFTQTFIDVDELKTDFDANFDYTEHQHYLGPLKAEKIYSNSQEFQQSKIFYTKSGAGSTAFVATESPTPEIGEIQGDLDRVSYGAVHLRGARRAYMEGSFHTGRDHEVLNVLDLQTQTKIRHGDNCGNESVPFSGILPSESVPFSGILPSESVPFSGILPTQVFELDPPDGSVPFSGILPDASVPFSGILPGASVPFSGIIDPGRGWVAPRSEYAGVIQREPNWVAPRSEYAGVIQREPGSNIPDNASVGTSEGISTDGIGAAVDSSELVEWGKVLKSGGWGYDTYNQAGGNSSGVSAIMEPEVSTNEDGSVNVVTAINYQELLLQNDYASQTLRRANPFLFGSLGNLIQVDSISMTRSEVHSRRQLNRLGTATGDIPSVSHKKETLITTSLVKGKLETKTKFVMNDGETHVVNPRKIKKAPDGFIGKGFHLDDMSQATNAAEIRQLDLTKNEKLAFIAITDNSISSQGGNKFKYGVEIEFTSKTAAFVKGVIKTLEDFSNNLLALQRSAELPGFYDYEKLAWKEDFFILMNQAAGFDVKKSGDQYKFAPSGNSTSTKRAIWVAGPSYYCAGMALLGAHDKKMIKKLFSLLNPISSDPDSLLSAHRLFVNLMSGIKKAYDLEEDSGAKFGLQSSSKRSIGTRSGIGKNKHVISKTFNNTVDAIPNPESGFTFLGAKKGSMPSMTKGAYRRRVKREKTKFFKKLTGLKGESFDGLTLKEKKALMDLDSAYSYFTPMEVKVGSQQKSLLEINKEIFDNEFFNKFSLVQAARFGEKTSLQGTTLAEESSLEKVATSFGFTISPSLVSIVEVPIEEQENFFDVRDFLGDNSHLSKTEEASYKLHLPTFSKEEKIDTKKLMANFANLKATPPVTREISLKNFDLQSKESSFKKYIGSKNNEKRLQDLPVSVKALLVDSKDNQSSVRFPMSQGAFDPLNNIQTRQSVEQNFLNIRKLEYLVGFKVTNGAVDMNAPIWKTADSSFSSQKNNHLCRLVPYEQPHLGIKSANNPAITFDSLFVMKGRK